MSIFDCLGRKDGMVFEKGVAEETRGVINLEERIAERRGGLDLTKESFGLVSKLVPKTQPNGSLVLSGWVDW